MPKILRNGEIVTITPEEYNQIKNLNTPLKHIDENGYAIGDDTTITISGITYGMETFFVNNIPFTGISSSGFTTVNTKTFVEEPTRQNDGSMPNIDDHETFIVPRATFNLKFFDIQSYRRLLKATESNSFDVKYFDKDFGKWVTHNMYLTPQEMTRIYNIGTYLVGVIDYEISFIGTLNNLTAYKLTFMSNYVGTQQNPNNIANYVGVFTNGTNYNKDDVIVWNTDKNYYKAIFYEDSFSEKLLSNTTYWDSITATLWNDNTTYSKGNVVYSTYVEDNETKYRWYEYINENSTAGASLSNTIYWLKINPSDFDNEKTYKKGDYVKETYTSLYKAIWENSSFVGSIETSPNNSVYWQQIPVVTGIKVIWGQSFNLPSPEDLFIAQSGMTAQKWNTKSNGTGYTYYPHKNITVTDNVTLYAIWEGQNE